MSFLCLQPCLSFTELLRFFFRLMFITEFGKCLTIIFFIFFWVTRSLWVSNDMFVRTYIVSHATEVFFIIINPPLFVSLFRMNKFYQPDSRFSDSLFCHLQPTFRPTQGSLLILTHNTKLVTWVFMKKWPDNNMSSPNVTLKQNFQLQNYWHFGMHNKRLSYAL